MSDLAKKVERSVKRLRAYEPDEGYYLAFSGGKDSVVCKALCEIAGVKYDAHYNVTSVDPPELVRFVLDKHKGVSFDIPHDDEGKPVTMWNLIPKKKMPPTRLVRYCCAELKEKSGAMRRVVTGVRWAESVRRANNRGVAEVLNPGKNPLFDESSLSELQRNKSGGLILNSDNDAARQELEHCYKRNRWVVNPIIDWEDRDVWDFIRGEHIPYCGLYDEGFSRLGCIGCPMGGRKGMLKEFSSYPKYKEAYLRAFARMIKERERCGRPLVKKWSSPEAVFAWWTQDPNIPEQISLFDELDEELDEEG